MKGAWLSNSSCKPAIESKKNSKGGKEQGLEVWVKYSPCSKVEHLHRPPRRPPPKKKRWHEEGREDFYLVICSKH